MLKANLVTADSSVASPIIVPLTMPGEQLAPGEKESEESLSPGKDLSTRFMNYEQIMQCLGRKTLAMRKAERRKIQEEQAQQDAAEIFYNPYNQFAAGFLPRLGHAPDGMMVIEADNN